MKVVYGNIYVHESNVGELHPSDAALVRVALGKTPTDMTWNVLKVSRLKDGASFMHYPHFFSDPHPALSEYTTVHLVPESVRHSVTKMNPMILHRKETFISQEHRCYQVFSDLTAQEERAGLYAKEVLSKIGRQDYWDALLAQNDLTIHNHQLCYQE